MAVGMDLTLGAEVIARALDTSQSDDEDERDTDEVRIDYRSIGLLRIVFQYYCLRRFYIRTNVDFSFVETHL